MYASEPGSSAAERAEPRAPGPGAAGRPSQPAQASASQPSASGKTTPHRNDGRGRRRRCQQSKQTDPGATRRCRLHTQPQVQSSHPFGRQPAHHSRVGPSRESLSLSRVGPRKLNPRPRALEPEPNHAGTTQQRALRLQTPRAVSVPVPICVRVGCRVPSCVVRRPLARRSGDLRPRPISPIDDGTKHRRLNQHTVPGAGATPPATPRHAASRAGRRPLSKAMSLQQGDRANHGARCSMAEHDHTVQAART